MQSNDFDEGYAAGAAGATANQFMANCFKLVGQALLLLWWVFYYSLFYSPLLFLGYRVMHALPGLHHGNRYKQAALIGGVAYLAYCTLFLLKGFSLGLREQGRAGWWLLLLPCIGLACGLPALVMHLLLAKCFASWPVLWTWIGGLGFATLVYQRYDFTRLGAPALAAWAYSYGLALSQRWVAPPRHSTLPPSQAQEA